MKFAAVSTIALAGLASASPTLIKLGSHSYKEIARIFADENGTCQRQICCIEVKPEDSRVQGCFFPENPDPRAPNACEKVQGLDDLEGLKLKKVCQEDCLACTRNFAAFSCFGCKNLEKQQ